MKIPKKTPSPSLPRFAGEGASTLVVLAVLVVLASMPAAAGELTVQVTLEPERIGIDETATLSIEVEGGGFNAVHFKSAFELDNFKVVGGPYRQDNIQIGAGRLGRSYRISWRLRALSTGRARVHSLRIRLRGDVVALGSREVEVQEEPTGLAAPTWGEQVEEDPIERMLRQWEPRRFGRPSRPNAFLRAEVRPLSPVAGQQVLYTVHLYTLTDVAAISPASVPDFRGFWVHDIPQPQKLPTDLVEIEGRRYGRVVLLQKALFPLRPGQYQIQPTEYDLVVRTFERSFFGPPRSHPESLRLRTPAMPLEVQPLPPAPAGFTGAVGRMALTAQVEPAELRMGEAATVTLTLAGEGNLQGIADPELPRVPGLTLLPPQRDGEDRIANTVVQGSRTWTYAAVPERAGSYRLKVPEMPFFDPDSRKFETAAVPPIRLTALPAPAVAAVKRRHAGMVTGLPDEAPAWSANRLLWLLAVPGVLALVLLLARRRNGAAGPVTNREARHRLERGLREAQAETRPRQAAARIEEAWREFLSERWEIPPGTPSTRWSDLLEARGADPGAAGELVRLADDLHYLRYAPQLSTCEPLCGEVLGRCRKLLRRLR